MIRRLLVIAAPLTLLVIVAGAYTRLSDAGLGCPDWPACYGQIIGVPDAQTAIAHSPDAPLDSRKAWIEVGHRYVAAILGLLILAAAFLSFRQKSLTQTQQKFLGRAPLVLLVLVIAQSLLGMLTVTEKLRPIVVSAHLLGGMSIIAVLGYALTKPQRHLAAMLNFCGGDVQKVQRTCQTLKKFALLAAAVLFIQIFSGGWVSTNYASLSCPDFPLCNGQWLPPNISWDGFVLGRELHLDSNGAPISHAALATIHWVHRALAILTALVFIALAGAMRRGGLRSESVGLLVLLACQILLGIFNVAGGLPLWSAVLHNAMAAMLVIKIAKIIAIVFTPLSSSATTTTDKLTSISSSTSR